MAKGSRDLINDVISFNSSQSAGMQLCCSGADKQIYSILHCTPYYTSSVTLRIPVPAVSAVFSLTERSEGTEGRAGGC